MHKILIALALFLLVISPEIYSLGVAQDFLQDDTMYLQPGASRLLKITLQNEESQEVLVTLNFESEIARIIDMQQIYTIPPTFYDKRFYMNISIPLDTPYNTSYSIGYSVQPLLNKSGAMIPLNIRLNKHFNVIVVDKNYIPQQKPIEHTIPEQEKTVESPAKIVYPIYLLLIFKTLIIIIALLGIIIFIWKKSSMLSIRIVKKKTKKRKKRK
jgi:hypothetical protein